MARKHPVPVLIEWSAAVRALPGQSICGDRHAVAISGHQALVAVADGLGHGEAAAKAATTAVRVLRDNPDQDLPELIRRCHKALSSTRGTALSLAVLDGRDDTLRWMGIGNVTGILARSAPRAAQPFETLALLGGVVGLALPKMYLRTLPLSRRDLLFFATDGVRSGFYQERDFGASAQEMASRMLDLYSTGKDDALVLAVRYLGWEN